MASKEVFIRADGGSEIGLGHIVRCIALAQMLKEEFDITFYSKELPEKIAGEIKGNGFKLIEIQTEADLFNKLDGDQIVVLDHYGLDSEYQKKIKQKGCKLVYIDDLHDKIFFADLIINHSPGIFTEDYQAQLYTQFALGLQYSLLRKSFLEAAGERKSKITYSSLFICFGGADKDNLTLEVLKVALAYHSFISITVVVGVGYCEYSSLEQFVSKYSQVSVYRGIEEIKMIELMQIADVAIVPASGILLETLAVGGLVISGKYVSNQELLYKNYKDAGAFIDAKDFSARNVKLALDQIHLNKKLLSSGITIDGKSGERIKKLFRSLQIEDEISLREVNQQDMERTFKWAVDPVVRKYSFSQNRISWEDHQKWLQKQLKDDNSVYLLARRGDEVVGSIRFDIKQKTAVISFLIDPAFHGMGLGKIILKLGLEFFINSNSHIQEVIGYVMPENIASLKSFESLGYNSDYLENEKKWKFTKKLNVLK